ncbi:MAG: tetratricopeptide repeat protein [Acidobacteriota bacterium]
MAFKRDNIIRSAEKYVSKGKLEAAIKEYRKVLAENPNDTNTLNRVGDLYARLERFDEAVRLFSQIAEQYTREGFYLKAIAIYKKIIKLDPTALMVYERLAELYHKQGLLNEARAQYQVLADYYQKHDNAASAITIYQRMSELEPDNPAFHLKLADLYRSQRLVEKAVREYRHLADLLIVNGSVGEAAKVYLTALEIGSDNLEFIREAVGGLQDGGHTEAAQQVLDKAIELNPEAEQLRAPAPVDEPVAEEPAVEVVSDPPAPTSFDDAFELPETSFGAPDDALGLEPSGPAPSSLEADVPDFGGDSQEVFTLDLDDEEEPDTMVKPPDDLDDPGDETGTAFADGGEFEFEIDLDEAEQAAAEVEETLQGAGTFGDETVALGDVGEDAVEISWEPMEDLDLELTTPDDEPVEAVALGEEPSAESAGVEVAAEGEEPSFEIDLEGFDAAEATVDDDGAFVLDMDMGDGDLAGLGIEMAEPEAAGSPAEASDTAPPEDVSPAPELADVELTEEPAFEIELDGGADRIEIEIDAEGDGLVEAEAPSEDPAVESFEIDFDSEPAAAIVDDEDATIISSVEEPDLPTEAEPESIAVDDAAADGDLDALEDDAPAVRREEDLMAEARVFAKYGLKDKARDRLTELLESHPDHLEARQLAVRLDLDSGNVAEVMAGANRLASLAVEQGDRSHWLELQDELVAAGYGIEGDAVVRGPGTKPVDDDRIAQLLEDLSLDNFDGAGAEAAEGGDPSGLDALLGTESADGPAAAPAESAAAVDDAPPPADGAPAEGKKLISLVDELGLDELDDEDDEPESAAEPAFAAGAAAEGSPADALDETGMSWLDEPTPAPTEAAAAPSETIFDEEDDFFDLAAELEAELDLDEVGDGTTYEAPQEQSLEEIIEGFKQGVAENLSPEDYDTHFNLGIAYREMGLMDEAIGEFQLASKDPRFLVEGASMLGLCFLEKGLPELAVRWYRKGLESPDIAEEATLGLLYDMGNAYLTLGDTQAAYKTFVEIYGLNTNFRDVSTRLQELAPQET